MAIQLKEKGYNESQNIIIDLVLNLFQIVLQMLLPLLMKNFFKIKNKKYKIENNLANYDIHEYSNHSRKFKIGRIIFFGCIIAVLIYFFCSSTTFIFKYWKSVDINSYNIEDDILQSSVVAFVNLFSSIIKVISPTFSITAIAGYVITLTNVTNNASFVRRIKTYFRLSIRYSKIKVKVILLLLYSFAILIIPCFFDILKPYLRIHISSMYYRAFVYKCVCLYVIFLLFVLLILIVKGLFFIKGNNAIYFIVKKSILNGYNELPSFIKLTYNNVKELLLFAFNEDEQVFSIECKSILIYYLINNENQNRVKNFKENINLIENIFNTEYFVLEIPKVLRKIFIEHNYNKCKINFEIVKFVEFVDMIINQLFNNNMFNSIENFFSKEKNDYWNELIGTSILTVSEIQKDVKSYYCDVVKLFDNFYCSKKENLVYNKNYYQMSEFYRYYYTHDKLKFDLNSKIMLEEIRLWLKIWM